MKQFSVSLSNPAGNLIGFTVISAEDYEQAIIYANRAACSLTQHMKMCNIYTAIEVVAEVLSEISDDTLKDFEI